MADFTFILTFLGIVVGLLTIVVNFIRGNKSLAAKVGLGLVGWVGLYLVVLLIMSFTSTQITLAANQEKCFDEMCFSVTNVRATKTLDTGLGQTLAQGNFLVVQVQLRNAAKRVSQKPDSPKFQVVDAQGNIYDYSANGETALAKGQSQPEIYTLNWTEKLQPGDKSERIIIFDLPNKVQQPYLVISEGSWPTLLVIGDENSFFHSRTRIRLF